MKALSGKVIILIIACISVVLMAGIIIPVVVIYSGDGSTTEDPTTTTAPTTTTGEISTTTSIESVQDFLIKLDIKLLMHLLEISNFSLNDVMLKLTKIMNRADKNWAHFK